MTKFGRMGFSAERAELRLIKCVFESRRQSLTSVVSESAEGRILRRSSAMVREVLTTNERVVFCFSRGRLQKTRLLCSLSVSFESGAPPGERMHEVFPGALADAEE